LGGCAGANASIDEMVRSKPLPGAVH